MDTIYWADRVRGSSTVVTRLILGAAMHADAERRAEGRPAGNRSLDGSCQLRLSALGCCHAAGHAERGCILIVGRATARHSRLVTGGLVGDPSPTLKIARVSAAQPAGREAPVLLETIGIFGK